MNERIKELIKQADTYAYNMNPEQDSYGRSANPKKFQQDRDAKFAELIIRECAQVCVEVGDANSDIYPEFGNGAYFSANRVKQHFGVEE